MGGAGVRLGVLGGTFDPVHIGHLVIAEEARERLDLDEIVFMPTGQPWLKAGQEITAAHHRMAMVELAVESNPFFSSSDMEVRRPGPTYTVDTLAALRCHLGTEAEIFLILGLDSLSDLSRWHEPRRIFELSTVVVMSRPGVADFDQQSLDAISPGAERTVVVLDGPAIGISGTDVRRRVAEGLSIKYRVPEAVEAHINEHGLYRAAGK